MDDAHQASGLPQPPPEGLRFTVLEHAPAASGAAAAGAGAPAVHWDLLIEIQGQERLATWRLRENPLGAAGPVAAERIGDHRRVYLDFEGEMSGGRGLVRRVDWGRAQTEALAGETCVIELTGARLRGRFEITRNPQGGLVFRRR